MDPLSTLGAVSLVVQVASFSLDFLSYAWQGTLRDVEDYGLFRGFLLSTVFVQARDVANRVREHVLTDGERQRPSRDSAKEAWSLKKSYSASFNMIAVAVSC